MVGWPRGAALPVAQREEAAALAAQVQRLAWRGAEDAQEAGLEAAVLAHLAHPAPQLPPNRPVARRRQAQTGVDYVQAALLFGRAGLELEAEEDATPAARRSAPGGPRRRALSATEGLPPALLPDPRSSIHQQRVLLRDQRARRLHAREVRQPARRLPGAGQAAAPRRSQEARPAGPRRPQAAQLAGLGRLQHQRHRHVASHAAAAPPRARCRTLAGQRVPLRHRRCH